MRYDGVKRRRIGAVNFFSSPLKRRVKRVDVTKEHEAWKAVAETVGPSSECAAGERSI